MLAAGFVTTSGIGLLVVEHNHFINSSHILNILNALFVDRGSRLFVSFLIGIAVYQLRYKIPYDWRVFLACAVWCGMLAIAIKPQSAATHFAVLNLFAAAPLIYMMAFIGVTRLPKLPLFHRGDYSYGIYLYGFPLQQLVFEFAPAIKNPVLCFLIEMPVIVLFAMFSWHVIESPILKMRKKFSFVARQRIAHAAAAPDLAGGKHDQPLPVLNTAPTVHADFAAPIGAAILATLVVVGFGAMAAKTAPLKTFLPRRSCAAGPTCFSIESPGSRCFPHHG